MFQAKRPKPPDVLESPGHLCLTYVRVQPVAKLSAPPGPARVSSGLQSVLGARLCPRTVSTGVRPRRGVRPRHGLFAGSLCARGHGSHVGPFTAGRVLPRLCTSLSGTRLSWSTRRRYSLRRIRDHRLDGGGHRHRVRVQSLLTCFLAEVALSRVRAHPGAPSCPGDAVGPGAPVRGGPSAPAAGAGPGVPASRACRASSCSRGPMTALREGSGRARTAPGQAWP